VVDVGVEAVEERPEVGVEVATRNVKPSKVVVTAPGPEARVTAGPCREVTIVASLPLI